MKSQMDISQSFGLPVKRKRASVATPPPRPNPTAQTIKPLALKQTLAQDKSDDVGHPPMERYSFWKSSNSEPAAKRRKLARPDPSMAQARSPSADTFVRSKGDASDSEDAETGADSCARPPLPQINAKNDTIIFQQIDVAESTESSRAPTLRMFGVTEAGNSVLMHVTGFLPYFYVAAPRGFMDEDCASLKNYLNMMRSGSSVRTVRLQQKRMWGYRGDDLVPFIKITVADQRSLLELRDFFERGRCRFKNLFKAVGVATFESNIAYTLRFMIDTNVVGMNWIEVPKGKYTVLEEGKKSRCQLEIQVRWDQFISHPPDGAWSKIAPLRVLSFDIECTVRGDLLPQADHDPVIQIANMVTRQGETEPFVRNIFTLNTCAPIVGSQVLSYQDESEMLQAWQNFVNQVDPDVIIGYNISNFDLPYLLKRAATLKMKNFALLGRIKGVKAVTKDTHFSSEALGRRKSKETVLDGRLQIDIMQYMLREHKLNKYTLNAVCAQFLVGEKKQDVRFTEITGLQNGTPETRRRLALYCLQDASLPQKLMDKLECLINYTEMARVTGVPFNYLLSRGQSIKALYQLFRKANVKGYVVPTSKGEGNDDMYSATLDFSSPHLPITVAHNLCYTTLVDKYTIDRLGLVKGQDYIQTTNNDFVVRSHRRKGLVPTILKELIGARIRAKADLEKETDPSKCAVLAARQLALEVSANSVYGFADATIGKLRASLPAVM
ncbi:ribonuclease H-like domain-containing protein [Cytidiella melzeri]|nr:ribonuclease H-like domain-containing protein [Cytidiella melzeri]